MLNMENVDYVTNHIIYKINNESDAAYIIIEGEVELSIIQQNKISPEEECNKPLFKKITGLKPMYYDSKYNNCKGIGIVVKATG